MRSDHRKKKKKEAESQKTNWRSDLAPFIFSTKSWRVKSAHRESVLLSFFSQKKRPGTKKKKKTLMSKHERCFFFFFAWGQIPERMRNQWIFKNHSDFASDSGAWKAPASFLIVSIWYFNMICPRRWNQCREQIRSPRTGYWCVCEHPLCECRTRMRRWRGEEEEGVHHKIQANCTLHRRYVQTVVSFTCTFTF